jgi:hypothetical protein
MKKIILLFLAFALVSQLSAYDKLSLVERFTNASCAPCASLNQAWYTATTHNYVNSGLISHLVYNVWWPGPNDPMYLLNQPDNTTRTNYYGCNAVPWIEVNANHISNTLAAFQSAVASGNAQFAPFKIDLTQEALSSNLIKVGVKITRDPNDVTSFGNVRLRVALTEKTVAYATPPGSNGETHFYSICRKMLPNAAGSTFNIPAPGESTELSLEYIPTAAFLAAVNLDSLRIVAFIQEDPSQTVYQSVMLSVVPNFVASISSISPDAIIENNSSAEFTTVLHNKGFMSDAYGITANFDGPAGWSGQFTTVNGTFNFGETDSVQVPVGDSTLISVLINTNLIDGSGAATVEFESKNNPGMSGSTIVRVVTTGGIEILVVDATENGYGELVAASVENVFPGKVGIVSRTALNPVADLDNFQMITWSGGKTLPAFHPDEVDALQNYLENGGNLFINGQDIGEDVFGTGGQSQFAQGFYNNYLHASFVGTGTSYLINGIPGDPITEGIQFVLNFSIYPPLPLPDRIAPFDSYASSIFTYLNGPPIAGIKASAPSHKVVYFGFCFEQVPDNSTRDVLISRMIDYFNVQQLPSAPVLVSPVNSAVIDSASVLFMWQQSQPLVSKYWLELDTSSQFSNPYVNSDLTDTTYLYSGLLPDKNYYWRVRALNPGGWGSFSSAGTFTTTITGIGDDESQIPKVFSLEQNYPNPFNPSTTITYSIPKESHVSLKIFDVRGREVATVVNERKSTGVYEAEFNASSLVSGVYFYELKAGEFLSVKKMVLLK